MEEHDDLLRRALHVTGTQLVKEELQTTFDHVLSIVVFMHNCLTVINGHTPCQALCGRQPSLLAPYVGGGETGQVESISRPGTNSRHESQVREIAAEALIRKTAEDHITRTEDEDTHSARNQ